MIRFHRTLAWPALLACAFLQLRSGAQASPTDTSAALFADPVVATGKGFSIKRSQVDDAYVNYSATVVAKGSSIPDAQRDTVRSNLLQHLIVNKILIQLATPDEKDKAAKTVDESIAQARNNAPSPEAFADKIKATGMSLEQMRARALEEQICGRILVREATNGIVVTDADVKKFYDDNPDKFKMPERVRAAHILVATTDPITQQPVSPAVKKEKLKLAQDLKARAEKGEDFAALVKQYSDDPGSKSKGGEYTFPRGQMVPEFEAAAFSMKTNQISDPVETQFGYHVIKLLEKMPAFTEEFSHAQSAIHDYLVEQKAEASLPAYLAKLKAGADVKLVDESNGKTTAAPAPAAK